MSGTVHHLKLLLTCFSAGGLLVLSARADETGNVPPTLEKDVRPLLEEYCFDCHNPDKKKGDINLEDVTADPKPLSHRAVWEKVADAVENGDMPPEKKPQLTEDQRRIILSFLDNQFAGDCKTNRNPGHVTIRRLNRSEYRNSIRDLLYVDYWPEDFPNDEVGYGFDNIGDVLSLSPLLMEKFIAAAEEVSKKAIIVDAKPHVRRFKGDSFICKNEDLVRPLGDDTQGFYREGEASRDIDFPGSGDYVLRIRAYGDQAGPEAPKLSVRIDGQELQVISVPAFPDSPQSYDVKLHAEKGGHRVSLAYLNNYKDENNPDPKLRGDRNVFVKYVELTGTADASKLPESHKRLITKMPQPGEEHAVAREILQPFLKRAYRRPVSDTEVERVVRFVDLAIEQKGTFLEGMQVAVQAVLCSPEFLFRWELDTREVKPGELRTLTDYQVASRLSYFLWSSMPDEELFALADKGELCQDGNLEKQTLRMMRDWRAREFVNNFADQWLQIRNIWEVAPDPAAFPNWNDELKGLMKEEAERFFEAIMKDDRSVLDLLDARFTFLNEKLARFYGIDGVEGNDFRRVELPANSPRGGVLTLGGVLLATSTPNRTSPVIRGKWILEQILGTPPPAPPPNVPPLAEQNAVNQSASLRQRLQQHMSKVECAACHKRMDPLGFALENFDATGAWRDKDGKFPVDASGKLPNGKEFNGPQTLREVLRSGRNFKVTLAEKMMTYALGRGVESYDRCAVDAVVAKMTENGDKFSALVTGIVTSEPFLKRKEPETLAGN